ncbi:hypothetical protein SARC_07100 [Sphaeroforma arctica JP610]|uniref:Uncharacterized protein n=1 Tax=Sphaeroforma arctica JP610 TaxID=667725 RepID=A0A0L0FX47_9EUKA|nr:hypothetical protein SARC_07100 [Sphaeroforma arctica JP610]KNC80528.1 hypothetical protein SARC_07100 [Sphaeroforma arctica JP610]|eukprot:XP_014154430.1 hypothetical protein SARC_07100 [Sphaeroforma arctica JP610]
MPVILLSPAKALDFSPHTFAKLATTSPVYEGIADKLVKELKKLNKSQVKTLLGVSEPLAALNYDRYQAWDEAGTKPTCLALNGPAFQGLGAKSMSIEDLDWMQDRLRIMSGLYGHLRPLDNIKPYRLDMSKKLKEGGMDKFWVEMNTKMVNEVVGSLPEEERFIVNCASQEYSKSVNMQALDYPIYSISLPGPSVFAKEARGAMVRHIICSRVVTPEGLQDFKGSNDEWRFVRENKLKSGIIEVEFHRAAISTTTAKKRVKSAPKSQSTEDEKQTMTPKTSGSDEAIAVFHTSDTKDVYPEVQSTTSGRKRARINYKGM